MSIHLASLIFLFAAPAAFAQGIPLSTLGPSSALIDEDFTTPIKYEFSTQNPVTTCPYLDDLMVSGITRITGQVSCIKKNTAPGCPAGTFAEQLFANPAQVPPRLEYRCRNVARAKCPDDYVWQSLDFGRLDPGPAGSPGISCAGIGRCVYRWRNMIQWQRSWPQNQTLVTGVFCNPNVYQTISNSPCTAVKTYSRKGTCYKPCPPCNGSLCSTCGTPYEPQVSATFSIVGDVVTCKLEKDESCGSFVKGYVQWGGLCVIKAPEYKDPDVACTQ